MVQERRNSREYAEGFAMLDLDDGAPWDLVCSLMQAAPRKRLSASAAAAHPALGGGITAALNSLSRRAGDAADKVRPGHIRPAKATNPRGEGNDGTETSAPCLLSCEANMW